MELWLNKEGMVVNVELAKSTNPNKKFDAVIHEPGARERKVSFGQRGAEDYTKHGDEDRRQRYLARHKPREDWNDYNKAGFWSARLLWNKPTLAASARDVQKKFPNLRVTF